MPVKPQLEQTIDGIDNADRLFESPAESRPLKSEKATRPTSRFGLPGIACQMPNDHRNSSHCESGGHKG